MNHPPQPFSTEQESYLKGFFQGIAQRPVIHALTTNTALEDPPEAGTESLYGTPIDELCREERIKLETNGLDAWDQIVKNGNLNQFPKDGDVFRYKFYGMFYVAPAQDSLMLRCRIPGGQLFHHQLRGLADIAETHGNGFLDITTRANFQIREITPASAIPTLTQLTDIGLTSKGAGADNVRNVTASPTAGFDVQEILDVMPFAREMHHRILNNRDLYGLPRKFNIAYDGGGQISACADTNDIGFYAVKIGAGHSVDPGVYFRIQLCGITGHRQFAKDCGILIRPEQHADLACAMLRTFLQHGNRTNRNRARLKYLIDDWGVERFLEETEHHLDFSLMRFPQANCEARGATLQQGHLGIHAQKHPDYAYVGVRVPVGRLSHEQLRTIANLSQHYARGEIRLTVWQNFLIPHVHKSQIEELKLALSNAGFAFEANPFAAGLVACTGNTGCKYAAANTKSHAVKLADELARRVQLDHPINIHLTGCNHSCAQHYIGDIGLIATPCTLNGASVEGYSIAFGGGVEERQGISVEMFKSIPFQLIPDLLEACLTTFLDHRKAGETFNAFIRRHSHEALNQLFLPHASTS